VVFKLLAEDTGGALSVVEHPFAVALFELSASRGTIVAMTTEPLRTVRDRLSEFVERVEQEHERVMITRNGRPAAVLVSPDDIEALEETLELLTTSDAVQDLRDAEAAVASGDVVCGVESVRRLRAQ
jgi:prevent-host-death family protein